MSHQCECSQCETDAALAKAIGAGYEKLREENARLRREIEVLRQYGNKDSTAQADEALGRQKAQPPFISHKSSCCIKGCMGDCY